MWDQVVKYIFLFYDALGEALGLLEVPKDVGNVIAFSTKSLNSLKSDAKWLGRSKLTSSTSLDIFSDLVIRLTWLSLCLGRIINDHYSQVGKKRINFVKEATEYDKSQQGREV